MANRKPVTAADFNRYLAESEGFERDWVEELHGSRRNAWRVAGVALVMALLGGAIGVAGSMRKPAPPAVVRVDNATGAVEYVGVMRGVELSYGEQTDKFWINQFMLCREAYEWQTIQECYDKIGLMAGQTVQAEYSHVYNETDGRQIKLANNARIKPHIVSITPNPETGTATVRFSTQTLYANGLKDPEQRFVATLAYRYVHDAKLSEAQRRVNLLGFQVTSYRADPEY